MLMVVLVRACFCALILGLLACEPIGEPPSDDLHGMLVMPDEIVCVTCDVKTGQCQHSLGGCPMPDATTIRQACLDEAFAQRDFETGPPYMCGIPL